MRSKVAAEVANANAAVEREARVARQNMTDLQRAMDQQRKRILDLQHNQDEYSVLKRDEESARTAYDSAMQRGNETQLESRLKNTNTAILNYAFPPMKPSSPRLLLNFALAVHPRFNACRWREFDQGAVRSTHPYRKSICWKERVLPYSRNCRAYASRGGATAALAGGFASKGKKPRMEPKIVERL